MTAPKSSKQLSLYRHPFVSAELVCTVCFYTMHDHYWIDGLEDAECICPPPQHANDER